MTRKTVLPRRGLEEPLDGEKVLNYLRRYNKKLRWQNDTLVLIPRETPSTRRRFQDVLDIRTQEDVARVRRQLKARRN
jgi:hypothetical protein